MTDVPDEAVDAYARAEMGVYWDSKSDENKDVYRRIIRHRLAAAAPALTRAAVQSERERMKAWVDEHAEDIVREAITRELDRPEGQR